MGNCLRLVYKAIRKKRRVEKTIILLIVGLDNAGKTVVLNRICGDFNENVMPTVGFRTVSLKYKSTKVKVYDLGGGSQIRAIWSKYYADVYGIIYVVDASDTSRLSENKSVLGELISHEHIAGKPILLLANKQDLNGAIDELDLVEHLEVEQVANDMRCPTRVETCSCIHNEDNSENNASGIIDGYKWLMDTTLKNYNYLNNRIKQAEKNESNKRRKSSISSKLSAWSNSFQPRQNSQREQGSSEVPDENSSNGSKLKSQKKFFLSMRNKTAPLSERLEINNTLYNAPNNVPMPRVQSHEDGFLDTSASEDIKDRQSVKSGENLQRPKTAPHIIENNFFN